MKKISKTLQCMLLSTMILFSASNKANAFMPIPPMPGMPELDVPGNITKVISNIQSVIRQAQTYVLGITSGNLTGMKLGPIDLGNIKDMATNIKSGDVGAITGALGGSAGIVGIVGGAGNGIGGGASTPNSEGEGQNKTPGRGGVVADQDLGLGENSTNEDEYFNAFHKLFVLLPSKDDYTGDYNVMLSAFNEKRLDYQQDIIVDTYLTGKMNEDMLKVVERTIDRLDACRVGTMQGNDCVFFGMQIEYMDPEQEEPAEECEEGDEECGSGSVGESKNAYIVSTVYDRLLRIVEDLTAIEAIYESSKQLDLIEPIAPESGNTSSAEDYIPIKYHFAYKSSNQYANAKLDFGSFKSWVGTAINAKKSRKDRCEKGGKGCPKVNEASPSVSSMDSTEIYQRLKPIDDLISEIMSIHNLKVEMFDYKTSYRKYLKLKEIHKRTEKVLKDSDKCVIDFLNRYSPTKSAYTLWYGGGSRDTDYDNRKGVSREILEKYQQYTTDALIGTTSDECRGFYEENACPSGYVSDKANPCEQNDKMYPCIVKTVTQDLSKDNNFTPEVKDDYSSYGNSDTENIDETDGFQDGNDAEKVDKENRKKAERAWRIGAEKLTELAKKGVLSFKQWNDQKNLQKEYLSNKYRNMRMIVRSIDKGMNGYKISSVLMGGFESSVEPMGDLIKKLTSVKTPQQAVDSGAAIQNVISQGMFSGFSLKPGTIYATKTVSTNYTERAIRSVKNPDGTRSTEIISVSKEGSIELKCEAIVSKTPGYVDIIEEQYVPGTKEDKIEVLHEKVIDLRIRNNQNSYASEFTRDPLTIEDLADLAGNTESCPKGWDFTITSIVRDFLKPTLGGCKSTTNEQVEHLRQTTKEEGRIVAQDVLDKVKEVRTTQENKMKEFISAYNNSIKDLQTQKENIINNRKQWTEQVDKLTKEKNDIISKKQESKEQLETIKNEIESLTSDSNTQKVTKAKYQVIYAKEGKDFIASKLAKEEEYFASRIKALEALANCIENAEEGYCVVCEEVRICDKKVKQDDKEKEKPAYCDVIASNNVYKTCIQNPNIQTDINDDSSDKTIAFISFKQADKDIAKLDEKIETYNTYIEDTKDKVKSIEEKILEAADKFAEDYVENAEDMQDAIEKSNKSFEAFVDPDDATRMIGKEVCVGEGPFKECTQYKGDDSLELTIKNFISNKDVKEYAKEKILELWLNGKNLPSFASLGLPDVLSVAEDIDIGLGLSLAQGEYSSFNALLDAIKEQIAEIAAKKVAEKIQKADEIMTEELEATLAEINDWSGNKLCLPGEGEAETNPTCINGVSSDTKYDYTQNINYLEPDADIDDIKENVGTITIGHKKLIEDIATPTPTNKDILEKSEIELREIFGIPNEDLIDTDSEYFVALPARGVKDDTNQNTDEKICNYENPSNDNSGCDYMAPKEPLASIPPLREVFYFSGADYYDVPKAKKKPKGTIGVDVYAPSISTLLDYKYEDEKLEYLPEVWRYILARPNMRNDGKYQQTFIERAYGKDKIISYLKGFDNEKMRLLLARSGVFPCELERKTIDLMFDANIEKNKDKIEKVAFQYTNNSKLNNQCKDVAFYKEYIQHLLADNNNAKKDKDNTAYAKIEREPLQGVSNNFSELAQFIYVDEVPRRQAVDGDRNIILYRRLLSNAFNKLTSKKKDDQANDVTRQLAEGISFKRNVMGSFLDNANKEFLARKSKDNSKEDIKSVLGALCSKIHEFGLLLGDEGGLEGDEKLNACVDMIMSKDDDNDDDTVSLAASSADNKYDVMDCTEHNSKSYYETIYCMLDNMKADLLKSAKSDYAKIQNDFSDVEKEKVQERLDEIKAYLDAFATDANEIVVIQPGYDGEKTKTEVNTAKANRSAALKAAESALLSMDNQNRNVAYCPVY